MNDQTLRHLAAQVGAALSQRELMLASAESCTGGWLGQVITSVAGSSNWYERGFITYGDVSKREMLGVRSTALEQYGAVSEPVARAMADGAIARSHAQVAVSITGVAGPSGGTAAKPVGTVCFAWSLKNGLARSQTRHFNGDREAIRRQAVAAVLQGVIDLLHDAGDAVA